MRMLHDDTPGCQLSLAKPAEQLQCKETLMSATTTEDITAWSTLAAVLVALGLSIVPRIWSYFRRPQLELIIGKEAPHRIAKWTKNFTAEGAEIRLQVRNKVGRTTATNVRIRLQSIWFPISDGKYNWADAAIDLVPLQWSSRRFADGRAGLDSDISEIPGGISDFAEFVYWDRESGNFEVRDSRRAVGDTGSIKFGKGSTFRCQLVISADRMTPLMIVAQVTGGEKTVEEVSVSKPPPADETRTWSIPNFIQDLRRDNPNLFKSQSKAEPAGPDGTQPVHSGPLTGGSDGTTIMDSEAPNEAITTDPSANESSP
jgi:hypothetical protein